MLLIKNMNYSRIHFKKNFVLFGILGQDTNTTTKAEPSKKRLGSKDKTNKNYFNNSYSKTACPLMS